MAETAKGPSCLMGFLLRNRRNMKILRRRRSSINNNNDHRKRLLVVLLLVLPFPPLLPRRRRNVIISESVSMEDPRHNSSNRNRNRNRSCHRPAATRNLGSLPTANGSVPPPPPSLPPLPLLLQTRTTNGSRIPPPPLLRIIVSIISISVIKRVEVPNGFVPWNPSRGCLHLPHGGNHIHHIHRAHHNSSNSSSSSRSSHIILIMGRRESFFRNPTIPPRVRLLVI
jgi:hypothetical protein